MAGEVKRQMGVALPDDLREQLQLAADAAGHSVAAEIRKRVERTFNEDAIDPVMRELIGGILTTALSIELDLVGSWHAHPAVHRAFAAAVAQRLADYKPAGERVEHTTLEGHFAGNLGLSSADDSPETIGRTHERHDRRSHSYPYLEAAQQAASRRHLRVHIKKKGDKS